MIWSRREVLRFGTVGAVAAVTGVGGGCRRPADLVPFGDFVVRETGGIDGRRFVLEVGAHGTALLMSRVVAAGQLAGESMSRLEVLLTSRQFRTEAAHKEPDPTRHRCADLVSVTVAMGALSVTRTDPCGQQRERPAPATAEILSILAAARQGDFTAPVPASVPTLQPVRLERFGDDAYVIEVDAAATGRLTVDGVVQRREALATSARDALRLLLPRLVALPAESCASPAPYALTVGRVAVCSSLRTLELGSVVRLLEDAFDR